MAACERLQMRTAQLLCPLEPRACWHRKIEWWSSLDSMWSLVAGSALACRGTHLRTLTQRCKLAVANGKMDCQIWGELRWRHHICSTLLPLSTIRVHSDPFTSSPQHHRHHHHHHPLSNSDKRQITSKLYFNTAPWKTRDWTWLQKHQHCLLAYLDSVLTCLPFHESPCANNLRQMISLLVQWEEMAGEQAHGARQLDKNMSQEKFIAIWVCLKIGYIPNNSHLIGIMIINHWV